MKLAKLSLAAIIVAGFTSSSFAVDNLSDAFKNGKVEGELKAYYFNKKAGDRDNDGDGVIDPSLGEDTKSGRNDIFTTGIILGYKTASLYGLSAAMTFQGSASPFADKGAKGDNGDTANFASDMYGSGGQLSEAYLAYTIGKTTAMVGRMFLDTPLVATSGSRVVKDSFEGAALINTDLPNTTLIAGYVQKYQDRTDGNGNIGKFKKSFGIGSGTAYGAELDNGAFTLAAINKSIPGLKLTAAYAQTSEVSLDNTVLMDNLKIAYAEAAYEAKAGSFTYGLAAQYYYNKFSGLESGIELDENSLWGVKGSLGYGDFGTYAAYTKVNKKENNAIGVVSGLGNGADLAYTMSPINSNSYENSTKSYKVGATYAVLKNANLGLSYTVNKNDADPTDTWKKVYTAVEADYAFEGALKGFSTSLIYEDGSKDASDIDALWLKANYKF